jgi:hypothetical protein
MFFKLLYIFTFFGFMIGGYLTPQNVSPLVQWSGCLHSTSESLIDAGSNLCNNVKGGQNVHRLASSWRSGSALGP